MAKYIRIDGLVDLMNNPVNDDQFWDQFIDWIESNGWAFVGTIQEETGDDE